jgi:hypothetical protein
MAASILIILFSTALLIYWFRYTCLLILGTRTGKDYAAGVAAANDLNFPGVLANVVSAETPRQLKALEQSLERDYRLLTYLLAHTVGANLGGITLEQRLLMLDFRLMRLLFGLTRAFAPSRARAAVLEMTEVLNHLANAMGERVQVSSRA